MNNQAGLPFVESASHSAEVALKGQGGLFAVLLAIIFVVASFLATKTLERIYSEVKLTRRQQAAILVASFVAAAIAAYALVRIIPAPTPAAPPVVSNAQDASSPEGNAAVSTVAGTKQEGPAVVIPAGPKARAEDESVPTPTPPRDYVIVETIIRDSVSFEGAVTINGGPITDELRPGQRIELGHGLAAPAGGYRVVRVSPPRSRGMALQYWVTIRRIES